MLDSMTDDISIQKAKQTGDIITPAEMRDYIKKGTRLFDALGDPSGPKDIFWGIPLENSWLIKSPR